MPIRRTLNSELEVLVGGRRMLIDLDDHIIGRLLYLNGEYEADVLSLMKYLDLSGSVCLDIGANIGLHTLVMSSLVGSSGKVFAYEPEPHNFRLLQHNLSINRATNTIAHRRAVGSKAGTCFLNLNPINFGDHRVISEGPSSARQQEVPLTTIDIDLEELPEGVIRLIKIDVQGYEYQVVRGMSETLARNPDAIMLLEVFPEALQAAGSSATELMSHLEALGFTGWELHRDRVLPISEPWVYELIRDGKDVNLLLSRNPALLRTALTRWYEEELSARVEVKK